MHAKVIILDGTLSHITDVYLFVKKKKIPFSFKRFQRKYHSVVSKKKASNISEIKSGTLITWSITTGV